MNANFTKANKVGLETLVLQSLTFRELGLGFGPGNPIDTDIQRGARRRFWFSLKPALLRDSLPPSRALESLRGIGGRSFNLLTALRCSRKDASQVGSLASGGSICPSHWYVYPRPFSFFLPTTCGLFLHLRCLISWADTFLVRKS